MKQYFIFTLALLAAAGTGFTLQRTLMSDEQSLPVIMPETISDVIGTQRPEFAMQDIENKLRNIKEWDGKVVLVNF